MQSYDTDAKMKTTCTHLSKNDAHLIHVGLLVHLSYVGRIDVTEVSLSVPFLPPPTKSLADYIIRNQQWVKCPAGYSTSTLTLYYSIYLRSAKRYSNLH